MTRRAAWLLASAAVAVAVYALMWFGYRSQWTWLHAIDVNVSGSMYGYGISHPGWTRCWDVFCTVFGPVGFRVLGAAVLVVALLRRNLRLVAFMFVAIGLSGLLVVAGKALTDRARPTGVLVNTAESSFPSGHAVGAMVGVLVLLTATYGLLRGTWRIAVIVIGALIVLAVGFGRIALVVHYPSDVVAGWALGYLWFLVCLFVFRPLPLSGGRNTASAR